MKPHLYILLLLFLSFSSCNRLTRDVENFEDYLILDAEALNKKVLAADSLLPDKNKEPIQITLFLFGNVDAGRTQEIRQDALNKGEITREVKVTFTMEGMMDDSVDGEKYVVFFKLDNNDQWIITKGYHAFKCQEGRGHQSYSKEKCS